MPFTLVRGSYQVVGASPDGDSVRFTPDDPGAWAAAGVLARVNAKGGAQLRLDAIDALETHYTPPGGRLWHQPLGLAGAAGDRLLELLGFTSVRRAPDGTVTTATPQTRPGFVLTRFADKYGRPVALAYADDGRDGLPGSGQQDGTPVWLDPDGLRSSTNSQLLVQGLVYPTFYSRLYVDLRAALSAQADQARQAGLGVWADDRTTTGFDVTSRQQVQDDLVVLPKLFRRIADYLTLQPPDDVDLEGFPAFLAARDDRLFTVPDGQATGFDTLVRVTGQHVVLTVPPERIVFLET